MKWKIRGIEERGRVSFLTTEQQRQWKKKNLLSSAAAAPHVQSSVTFDHNHLITKMTKRISILSSFSPHYHHETDCTEIPTEYSSSSQGLYSGFQLHVVKPKARKLSRPIRTKVHSKQTNNKMKHLCCWHSERDHACEQDIVSSDWLRK